MRSSPETLSNVVPEEASALPSRAPEAGEASLAGKIPDAGGAERDAEAAKTRAALSSVLWSGLLTLLKIAAGISSNSLGMLSEALHSALDLAAASITFLAVRVAARPADATHPFGHGKVENLSALAETLLLFLTCGWIVWEAVERLFFHAATVEPSWWVFGVVVVSLTVDVSRSAMLRRVARKHRSQALEADALHFTTDVWSSAVVLIGLICVAVSPRLDPDSPLRAVLDKADAVAALGVAVIVVSVSWRLACRAVTSLMDGGGQKEAGRIRAALAEMAPAYQIRLLRVRDSGSRYFVELTVAAPASLRVDAAHDITDILEEIIASVLPGAETSVHVEPEEAAGRRDLLATTRHLASLRGLYVHGVALVMLDDGLHVFAHVELPPDMPLPAAHALVSAYEEDVSRRVGAVHVITHMEPLHPQRVASEAPEESGTRRAVLDALGGAMARHPDLWDCHDVEIGTAGRSTSLSFRCCTDAAATVNRAHQRASLLEDDLRRSIPRLGRVTIHVEPDETGGRG